METTFRDTFGGSSLSRHAVLINIHWLYHCLTMKRGWFLRLLWAEGEDFVVLRYVRRWWRRKLIDGGEDARNKLVLIATKG